MLFALHPDAQRTLATVRHQKMDALTVAYLRVLLRSQPDDKATRYALARDLTAIGEHAEARALLAPLAMSAGAAGLEARLALLQIDQAAMKQQAPADPRRPQIAARIAHRGANRSDA
jgi:cytochrome c-type biogenesis protein CcmH/NrfG